MIWFLQLWGCLLEMSQDFWKLLPLLPPLPRILLFYRQFLISCSLKLREHNFIKKQFSPLLAQRWLKFLELRLELLVTRIFMFTFHSQKLSDFMKKQWKARNESLLLFCSSLLAHCRVKLHNEKFTHTHVDAWARFLHASDAFDEPRPIIKI